MTGNDRRRRRKEIFERFKMLLIKVLKIMREKKPENRPKIDWETDLIDHLEVDSLESIDLMNAIEEEFQVSPNLNEANSKRRISQIVDYILELEDQKSTKG